MANILGAESGSDPENRPRICPDCGLAFITSNGERAFYARRAAAQPHVTWQLPKRCEACRQMKRKAHEVARVHGKNIELVCKDCAAPFLFRAPDQQFYAARGFQTPRRCPPCRRVVRPHKHEGA